MARNELVEKQNGEEIESESSASCRVIELSLDFRAGHVTIDKWTRIVVKKLSREITERRQRHRSTFTLKQGSTYFAASCRQSPMLWSNAVHFSNRKRQCTADCGVDCSAYSTTQLLDNGPPEVAHERFSSVSAVGFWVDSAWRPDVSSCSETIFYLDLSKDARSDSR